MQRTARKGARWLLLLSASSLAIAGCGGSSKTTVHNAATSVSTSASTAPASPSSPFVAQADAICGRINAEIAALEAKSGSAAEVKRVVPLTISLERKGIVALEKLNPPASLARDWRSMLGYRRALAVMLGELLDAAKKNDGASVKPLAASKKRVHASLRKTATANGFKDCAKVGRVG